jgi:hypothetical protein
VSSLIYPRIEEKRKRGSKKGGKTFSGKGGERKTVFLLHQWCAAYDKMPPARAKQRSAEVHATNQ